MGDFFLLPEGLPSVLRAHQAVRSTGQDSISGVAAELPE